VEVAVALMPQPLIITGARDQAEWLCDIDSQQVQPVHQALDTGDQPPLVVVDLEYAMLRMDVGTPLIELPKTDYVGAQPRDVVHPREWKVFIGP
jgi:hypothetical protein